MNASEYKREPTFKIPKKYRAWIIRRVNPSNARLDGNGGFEIKVGCHLCRDYSISAGCVKCPVHPCLAWLRKTLDYKYSLFFSFDRVFWRIEEDDAARSDLLKIRDEINKQVEWI